VARDSRPLLLALAGAFLASFWLQRARSPFLGIEADRDAAAAVASRHGLSIADAMALRELIGTNAELAVWHEAAATFARCRGPFGDNLAAIAVADPSAAAALEASPDRGDRDLLWRRWGTTLAAAPGLRFSAVRARFAARTAASD
jgi:hypothetical protein